MEIVHDFMVKILIFKLNIVQNYKCQIIFKILNDMTLETFTQKLGWAGLPSSIVAKYWDLRDGLV